VATFQLRLNARRFEQNKSPHAVDEQESARRIAFVPQLMIKSNASTTPKPTSQPCGSGAAPPGADQAARLPPDRTGERVSSTE